MYRQCLGQHDRRQTVHHPWVKWLCWQLAAYKSADFAKVVWSCCVESGTSIKVKFPPKWCDQSFRREVFAISVSRSLGSGSYHYLSLWKPKVVAFSPILSIQFWVVLTRNHRGWLRILAYHGPPAGSTTESEEILEPIAKPDDVGVIFPVRCVDGASKHYRRRMVKFLSKQRLSPSFFQHPTAYSIERLWETLEENPKENDLTLKFSSLRLQSEPFGTLSRTTEQTLASYLLPIKNRAYSNTSKSANPLL